MHTKAKRKHRYHLNTLWSIWYGILFTYFQGYLILNGAYRFLGRYISMNLHFPCGENKNIWNEKHQKKKIHFRYTFNREHSLNVEINEWKRLLQNSNWLLNSFSNLFCFSFFLFSHFLIIFHPHTQMWMLTTKTNKKTTTNDSGLKAVI